MKGDYYGDIVIQHHWDEVRNAWFGPESWDEIIESPSVSWIDDSYEDAPRGYFRAYRDYLCLRSLYAKWWRWPDIYIRYNAASWLWRPLSALGRRGVIHSSAAPGCVTRFRDLRFGRRVE